MASKPDSNPPTVIVTLYAPSLSRSIDKLEITSARHYDDVLEDIRTALNVQQPWPYNTRRFPIKDFNQVEAGQTLLIATDYFETPLPDKERDVYVLGPRAATRAWVALTQAQKYAYISGLRRYTTQTGKMYLTSPSEADIFAPDWNTSPPPACSVSLAVIQTNWDFPLDAILGFQGMVMPYGELETWEERLLEALSVLSEATIGQGGVVGGLVVEEVKKRIVEGEEKVTGMTRDMKMVVRVEDIVAVARELYRRGLE